MACEGIFKYIVKVGTFTSYLNRFYDVLIMIQLLNDPAVFFGQDILIDIFSAIVVFTIGFFSIKSYKLSGKNKNHLWIAASFFLLGIGFIFEILTNFTLYREVILTKNIGLITLTYTGLLPTNTLYFLGTWGYEIFTLIGLYLLFMLYQEERSITNFIITTYLLLISMYFIQKAFIFNMTALLLLVLITREYYVKYQKNKLKTTRMLIYSFATLAVGNLIAIFVVFTPTIHAIAGAIQLVGYIILLITFILILNNAKKKR